MGNKLSSPTTTTTNKAVAKTQIRPTSATTNKTNTTMSSSPNRRVTVKNADGKKLIIKPKSSTSPEKKQVVSTGFQKWAIISKESTEVPLSTNKAEEVQFTETYDDEPICKFADFNKFDPVEEKRISEEDELYDYKFNDEMGKSPAEDYKVEDIS